MKLSPKSLLRPRSSSAQASTPIPETGLSIRAAEACAQAILNTSTVSPDGFANLRFAALANVPPGSPFFPAAYHRGGRAAIALATESADLAVESVQEARSLTTVRQHLVTSIETHAGAISLAAEPSAAEHSVRYLGIDFSLAPISGAGALARNCN